MQFQVFFTIRVKGLSKYKAKATKVCNQRGDHTEKHGVHGINTYHTETTKICQQQDISIKKNE